MQIRHIGEQHKHSQTQKARTAPARYRQNIELSNSALIALFDRSPGDENCLFWTLDLKRP